MQIFFPTFFNRKVLHNDLGTNLPYYNLVIIGLCLFYVIFGWMFDFTLARHMAYTSSVWQVKITYCTVDLG